MRRRPLYGVILVLGAAVLWGTTGTAQSFAPPGLSAYWIGAFRLLAAATFFTLWLLASDRAALAPRALARLPWGLVAGAGLSMTAYNLAFFAGIRASSVSIGTALALGSGPVWAGLLQIAGRGGLPLHSWWLGVGIAVGGLVVALTSVAELRTSAGGIVLCLLAGLSYAVYARLTSALVACVPDAIGLATGAVFTLAALFAMPAAAALAGSPGVSAGDLPVLVWLGVAATGIAYLLFAGGLRHVSSATAVALALAEPVAAVGFALLLVGERPGGVALAGLGAVLVGLAVLVRAELARSVDGGA